MCPMASLFNLIGDPCKSMWNSSVKLDLFSSAIFKVLFSSYFGLFSLDCCVLCVFCSLLYWIIMASAPKFPKMSQEEPTKVTITYPADEEHWDRDLPIEHGQ